MQDANGFLKMQQHIPEDMCSVATQSLFENAFVRRNLALDMADVMSFELGERLRRSLVAALTEDVPPGYCTVSLNQLVTADKKFWVKLASETCGGVKRCGEPERPGDVEGAKILEGVLFNLMLAPRAFAPATSVAPRDTQQAQGPSKKSKEVIRQHAKVEKAKAFREQLAAPGGKGSQGGKAKGGKGAKGNPIRLPPGLEGMATKTSAATGMRRLCFGFNLGSCQAASPGNACAKGLHACMKPLGADSEACGDNHAASACTE